MDTLFDARPKYECARILAGLFIVYVVFESSAHWLGSERGQAGLAVCAIVLTACLCVERIFFGQPTREALRALGFVSPTVAGSIIAIVVAVALLVLMVAAAGSKVASMELTQHTVALMPGLFAQAGIAAEALFRGYLYRHFRERRSATYAAALSMLPVAAAHLLLFLALSWNVAVMGFVASAALSFQLARLFEIAGNSIWPPVLVHFVIQAIPRVVGASEGPAWLPTICSMIAGTLVLWLILAIHQQLRSDNVLVPGGIRRVRQH